MNIRTLLAAVLLVALASQAQAQETTYTTSEPNIFGQTITNGSDGSHYTVSEPNIFGQTIVNGTDANGGSVHCTVSQPDIFGNVHTVCN
jgi:hypothetical protein